MEMSKSKKIFGAVFSSALVGLFFIFMVGILTYFQFTEEEVLPMGPYIFLMCLFGIPLLAVIVNLISRIREVLGGEEDEASKY